MVTENTIGCQGYGAIGTMVGGNVKWRTTGENLLAAFLIKLIIYLCFNKAVIFLCMYPRGVKIYLQKAYTRIWITTLI